MRHIETIRDWLWPLLPKMEAPQNPLIECDNINTFDNNILRDICVTSEKAYQDEFERLRSIESKASMFIGTTTFLATLIIGISTLLVNANSIGFFITILIIMAFILTTYMAGVLYYSIKALERDVLYYIDIRDQISVNDAVIFTKRMICDYINATTLNHFPINKKVNFVVTAQRYYKRVLISLCLYVFFLLNYCISKYNVVGCNPIVNTLKTIDQFNPSPWMVITVFGISVVSMLVVILNGNKK